jgi:hypothetical protein
MKTPRVLDFDPNAQLPELGSPMDHLPPIQKPPERPQPSQTALKEIEQDQSHPSARTDVRPPVRTPVRRLLTRYAFEFYQDQVEQLRRLSLEEKIKGGKVSMSEMVREAIDEYLAKKTKNTD